MLTMIFRVVDGAGGEPIREAEVRLPHLEPAQEHRTDEEGVCRIELQEPLPEHLGVFVQRSGFVPVRVVWDLSGRGPGLPEDYTLALERATSIGGRVRDERGGAIEGATVYLNIWAAAGDGGGSGDQKVKTNILNREAVTDAEGRWHCFTEHESCYT